MAKVGNYIQRDYHSRFSSKRKSTWSDFNKSWAQRRTNAAKKMQQLRSITNNFATISTQASQANTAFLMQNRGGQDVYSSPTAVMSRINILV